MLTDRVHPGDVIEVFLQKRIIVCGCLNIKKNKLHVLCETGRELNIPESRAIHITRNRFDPGRSNSEILAGLREISRNRGSRVMQLDLADLWEQLNAEGTTLSLSDLAELAFSEGDRADNEAVLNRAIYADKNYFTPEGNTVRIQTRSHIEKTLTRREKEKTEETEKETIGQWLIARRNNQAVSDPPAAIRFINALKALATDAQDQPDRTWLKDILQRARQPSDDAFSLLLNLGVFDADENLDLVKYPFYRHCSPQTENELESIPDDFAEHEGKNRLNLRHLTTFTVDSAETKDMDDAISVDTLDDGIIQIGIHITDASAFVQPGSFLDQEAREKAQTLYMPDDIIHMFPRRFSEQIASLVTGTDRLALSTLVTFDPEGAMTGYRIVPSVIHIHDRFSYEEVSSEIDSPVFAPILRITSRLRRERLAQGAVIMPRPELTIRVDENRRVTLHVRERETESQIIVSELMILANFLAARTAADKKCPFPFRYQDPPTEDIPVAAVRFDPLIAYRQRRLMNRAGSSIDPRSHFSLGLSCYTNVTSPLRRYFDLLAQRQLKAIVDHEEPYGADELAMLIYETDAAVTRANAVVMNREKYWLLKYFKGLTGKTIKGIVLDKLPHRYLIWLSETCTQADFPAPFGISLQPGQEVRVILERSDPQQNILKLRLQE
ncbi:RNB domain-containing ribonuclease [bacterium]|nr:RNB domain-containing ribonuclease [candidate division CSSED10-310 bacterium]